MNISIDFDGCYNEHKLFFDDMSNAMKLIGNRVGVITGLREDKKNEVLNALGFEPDFVHMWGEFETVGNASLWKCQKMDLEDVFVHFDDDATEMKRYTQRGVIKVLNSSDKRKF